MFAEKPRDFFITDIKGIVKTRARSPFDDNWHHQREDARGYSSFIYILSGEAMLYPGDFSYHVKTNDIIYLPAHLPYESHGLKAPFYYYHIAMDTEEKSDILDMVIHDENQYFLKRFERIFDKWQKKERQYLIETKSLIYSLAAELFNERDYIKHPNHHYEIISRAISYIESNITDAEFSVNDLITSLGVSDTYFRNIFKEYHNMTPMKYITGLRINKAKDYLENSDMSVSHIAAATGFSNLYYFSNTFKSVMGISPLKYRQKHKTNM